MTQTVAWFLTLLRQDRGIPATLSFQTLYIKCNFHATIITQCHGFQKKGVIASGKGCVRTYLTIAKVSKLFTGQERTPREPQAADTGVDHILAWKKQWWHVWKHKIPYHTILHYCDRFLHFFAFRQITLSSPRQMLIRITTYRLWERLFTRGDDWHRISCSCSWGNIRWPSYQVFQFSWYEIMTLYLFKPYYAVQSTLHIRYVSLVKVVSEVKVVWYIHGFKIYNISHGEVIEKDTVAMSCRTMDTGHVNWVAGRSGSNSWLDWL